MNDIAGVIRIFGGIYAPSGYVFCDGSTYQISQYPNLYAVIKNLYGGDGITNFRVPDLRGDVMIGAGQGSGLTNRTLATGGGTGNVTLLSAHLPPHSHGFQVSSKAGTTNSPVKNVLAAMSVPSGRSTNPVAAYGTTMGSSQLNPLALSFVPGTNALAHNNLMPYQVFNFIICTGQNQ